MLGSLLLVTLAGGCGSSDDGKSCEVMLAPHNCSGSGCIGDAWSSDKSDYATRCTVGADCQSGLCALDPAAGAQRYCTRSCDPQTSPTSSACPRGASCFAAAGGALHVCGPPLGPADTLCH